MKTNGRNKSSGGTSSEEWRSIKNAEAFLNELLLATRSTIQHYILCVPGYGIASLLKRREHVSPRPNPNPIQPSALALFWYGLYRGAFRRGVSRDVSLARTRRLAFGRGSNRGSMRGSCASG